MSPLSEQRILRPRYHFRANYIKPSREPRFYEAFRLLDKHSREDTWQIRDHLTRPWYRKLHDDPRWRALLEQYEMTDEQLASLDLDIRLPPGAEL